MRSTRWTHWLLPTLGLVLLAGIYEQTACTGFISYGDSAELVAASYTMGIPHAPGYPLYMLLGKLFSLLGGNVGRCYSLFSALCGLGTVTLVFLMARRLTSAWLAGTAALSLAFAYHFWLYSLVPEVTSLYGVFVAGVLYLLLPAAEANAFSWKRVYALAAVYGLSFSHHHAMILLAPALAVALFPKFKQVRWNFSRLTETALVFGLGLLPYIYLPLASARHPVMNALGSAEWGQLLGFIARENYGAFYLATAYQKMSLGIIASCLQFYFENLLKAFTLPGLGIAAVGCIGCWLKRRRVFWVLILAFFFMGPFFYAFTRMPPAHVSEAALLEKFLAPSYIIFALLLSLGLHEIRQWLQQLVVLDGRMRLGAAMFFLLGSSCLPAWLLAHNWARVDKSGFQLSEMYVEDLFKSFPPHALVLIHGDSSLFSCQFFQRVVGQRQDVDVRNFSQPGAREVIATNVPKRPVIIVGVPGTELTQNGLAGNPFWLEARGLVFQVRERAEAGMKNDPLWDSYRFQGQIKWSGVYDLYSKETLWFYAIARYHQAVGLEKNGDWNQARQAAEQALRIDPELAVAAEFLEHHQPRSGS